MDNVNVATFGRTGRDADLSFAGPNSGAVHLK
jgi:hypothetical protein